MTNILKMHPSSLDEGIQHRIENAKPANGLSHALLLCYRNCRYLQDVTLLEPAMRILARVIWADEDRAVDDVGKARVLAAFDNLGDADEGDDDPDAALDALREVAADVTPHGPHWGTWPCR